VWVAPYLPSDLANGLVLPSDWGLGSDRESALLRLRVGDENIVSRWVFALVAPFPTIVDDISSRDLLDAWWGETIQIFAGAPLLMDESTWELLRAYWGEPAPKGVRVLPADQLLDQAWGAERAWAIVPFDQLSPRWKVLSVDGVSPIHKDFDPEKYKLSVPISLVGENAPEGLHVPSTNRDPEKMTVLAMTGVTALVRATASTMERRGITYPAQDVGPLLRAADLTHISNEVPFAVDCPFPDPFQIGMRFCSDDRYIELLRDVGTDIVELTGDHFSDWGQEAMLHTLEMYDNEGWLVYGGGADLAAGQRALTVEHNGNRLALIGCNAKGVGYARASADTPGAVPCDFDWMESEVQHLRAEGYLPIVTFQHFEYYTYAAEPDQQQDARLMTAAGAIIVSGSQAHHPQAFEFSNGGLVHHGLGNLFFDQFAYSHGARQGFIDQHIFYDGRHISTELITILFIDFARPRLMTAEERIDLLSSVFSASEW
jgi:poly-gamma-glutamate synthesis protein (capsule biosynthesis protein)